jgi:hypothetical protein
MLISSTLQKEEAKCASGRAEVRSSEESFDLVGNPGIHEGEAFAST